MGALSAGAVVWCAMCRGRGWRFVSSRLVTSVRAVDGGEERLPRRACVDCSGTGQVAECGSDSSVGGPGLAGGVEVGVGS